MLKTYLSRIGLSLLNTWKQNYSPYMKGTLHVIISAPLNSPDGKKLGTKANFKPAHPVMLITNKEYSDHKIFNELKACADFYGSLSFSIMSFVSQGTTAITFDTYIFTSIQGTIESISLLLKNGHKKYSHDTYAQKKSQNNSGD